MEITLEVAEFVYECRFQRETAMAWSKATDLPFSRVMLGALRYLEAYGRVRRARLICASLGVITVLGILVMAVFSRWTDAFWSGVLLGLILFVIWNDPPMWLVWPTASKDLLLFVQDVEDLALALNHSADMVAGTQYSPFLQRSALCRKVEGVQPPDVFARFGLDKLSERILLA